MMLTPGDSPHAVPWVEAFSAAGHEVLVYAYPPCLQRFEGAAVVRVVEGRGPIGRARWVRRVVAEDVPDVVSLHFVGSDAFVLSRLGKPLVLSAWGSDILLELARRPLKRALVMIALRAAALVVSPAAHLTRRLNKLGVTDERVLTLQYGVDTSVFAPAIAARDEPVRIVCTRGMKPVYGNEDIVRAAALVAPDHVSEVVFSAAGPLLGDLRVLSNDSGAPVRFLGGVPHDEMSSLLQTADIYCSMSRSDGTSLSLLEAMACGLAPVVSDIAANREWIDDGVDGRLVALGDIQGLAAVLSEVAADIDFRRRARVSAREKVLECGDRAMNMARIVAAVEKVASHA